MITISSAILSIHEGKARASGGARAAFYPNSQYRVRATDFWTPLHA